jgi:hypothetical protein
MHLISVVFAFLIVFILSVLSYLVLLTINNVIWGYKGISVDKKSPVYKKRKRSLVLISIALSILILIIMGLGRTNDNKKKSSSGLKEQILMLAHKSGRSATNLQKALNGLDKITDLDTIPKINEAIAMVERVQLLFFQANQDADALSDFINQNKLQVRSEGLTAFIDVEGIKNETYFSHRKALRDFLSSHKEILEYLRDNLEPIKRGQQPQSNAYNQLYFKYSNTLDAHNEAYLKHMKFVEQYSREHPSLFEIIDKARKELREK